MMLIEAPFYPQKARAQTAKHAARHDRLSGAHWRKHTVFLDGDRELIFQLNAITQPVVDIEVRHLVRAGCGVPIADPAKIDLPMLVPRSFRIIGPEGRPSLRHRSPNKYK